eukprot:CAMPEP_0174258468 /NCGR_PEP_ID=MMETSP0439-20130205/7454_1 /TAXON_ID=0 /ORGANISM="Stereomyxa ramosa, Strain Chinc5" /LENGTH=376 /DNA_ID=CAMNT_0015341987 /DNA_START=30 /DNA_END=1160 /DNA_ORIENTATION=+
MKYNNLGRSGLLVSKLSLGCMTFSEAKGFTRIIGGRKVGVHGGVGGEKAYEFMKVAYEGGVNFFDNAETYGLFGESEIIMGQAVALGIEEGTWDRSDLVISTKIFGGYREGDVLNAMGLSRKHIVEGLRGSLKRMKLDYVDLVFCHRADPRTPMEETVRAMNHVIDLGLAFYWGTSEWSAQQIQEAKGIAERLSLVPPIMEQCQYNLIHRQKVEVEYLPFYPDLGLTTWSPLASGLLTGKYVKGVDGAGEDSRMGMMLSVTPEIKEMIEKRAAKPIEFAQKLNPIAEELGCSMAQLAVAWCAANPNVTSVIIGATKIEQLKENLEAIKYVDALTPEIMQRIEEEVGNKPQLDDIMKDLVRRRGFFGSPFTISPPSN